MRLIKLLSVVIATLVIFITACSDLKTDEERILDEIDTASVHLTLGLKIIAANPNNDPDIAAAQETLKEVLEVAASQNVNESLSFLEMGKLTKVAYQAKQLGAEEVSLGKQTNFRFLKHVITAKNKEKEAELTVEMDHALTLGAMYLSSLNPVIPLPISRKALLYEAWMAGDAKIENKFLDDVLRAAQIATFSGNDFCDFASQQAESLHKRKLEKINIENIKESFSSLLGMGKAAAHAPELLAFIGPVLLAPAIIEILPGSIRIMAFSETAGCFERLENIDAALKQYEFALDAMEDMGLPENELALLRASISYKKKDFDTTRKQLKIAAESKLLDERSQQDLVKLANSLESPDNSLEAKYLGSANLSFTVNKIIYQRLIDEGVYDEIRNSEQIQKLEKMYSGLAATNTEIDDLLDVGKKLFK